MSITHHRFLYSERSKPRVNRSSLWLLIVVVVAAFLALTFGDAHGAGLF